MRCHKIIIVSIVAAATGAGLSQQFAIPARAATPIVRASYQGIGSGVNENIAVIWLFGSDGALKLCSHSATGTNADAPVCSAAVVP
jgi:hypothetical protein